MIKSLAIRIGIILLWSLILLSIPFVPKLYQKHDKTIHILAWGDILDPKLLKAFEEKTGIRVRCSYYSSNAELLVKLKATKGNEYDLIIPSDYATVMLIQEGLLQPLDHAKLPYQDVHQGLLGHAYDPESQYTIPFAWEVFVFGIHQETFKERTPSWRLVFDPSCIDYRIAMVNDPVEAIAFASFYLFQDAQTLLNPAKVLAVRDLLRKQRSVIEAYASFRGDYFLATGSCSLAIASSSYFWRTLRLFPHISLLIPEEGTFLTIENFAIPKYSKQTVYTYELLAYLFTQESMQSHFHTLGFFPSTWKEPPLDIPQEAAVLMRYFTTYPEKFHFVRELLSQQQTQELWIDVKSD